MPRRHHYVLGCAIALVIPLTIVAIGCVMFFNMLWHDLPFGRSDVDVAQERAQAAQIEHEYDLQLPWLPWTVGARNFAIICVFLSPGAGLAFLAFRTLRHTLWVWPRDGSLPVPAWHLARHPELSEAQLAEHHATERTAAGRPVMRDQHHHGVRVAAGEAPNGAPFPGAGVPAEALWAEGSEFDHGA